MKDILIVALVFSLHSLDVKETKETQSQFLQIIQKTNDSINYDDTLVVDFKKGIISPSPVYWGVTRFKEIKRMFGKAKIHNSSRYIFSPTYGFFPVQSSLIYPEIGLQFTYESSNNIKGSRSIFQNHKVNQVIISKNCKIKSIEGVRFGDTYFEICKKLHLNNPHLLKNGTQNTAHFALEHQFSNGLNIYVKFVGEYAEKQNFILNKSIQIFYFR